VQNAHGGGKSLDNGGSSGIIYITFAGRERFLEIQKIYVFKLLERYPNMEWHLWDFSRNLNDHKYLLSLSRTHSRIKLFQQFYEGANLQTNCVKAPGFLCSCPRCKVGKWSQAWQMYSSESYLNTFFIKMDDDIVFWISRNFRAFFMR
jgi:hypothetical protein